MVGRKSDRALLRFLQLVTWMDCFTLSLVCFIGQSSIEETLQRIKSTQVLGFHITHAHMHAWNSAATRVSRFFFIPTISETYIRIYAHSGCSRLCHHQWPMRNLAEIRQYVRTHMNEAMILDKRKQHSILYTFVSDANDSVPRAGVSLNEYWLWEIVIS